MEKIVITPQEVRGLGNIVSPKSRKDFLGSKITSGTTTVQGIPSTVYTSTYLPTSKLSVTGNHFIKSGKTLKLKVSVTDNNDAPIHSGRVYCIVQNKTYSASIKSDGTCTLSIGGLIDGLHTLKVYYLGTSSIGGSFRDFTVVVGDELALELFCTSGLVQPGLFSELFGIVSSMGIGVPGLKVDFFEEFVLTLVQLFASKSIFQTGDSIDITARVSDSDGSGVAEQLVEFYEEFDINLNLFLNPPITQNGGYSEITVQLSDSDGSPIRNQQVKFYEEYTLNKISTYCSTDIVQTGTNAEVYAVLSDTDGSRIPGFKVDFYEYFEYSNFTVMSTSQILQTGGTVDISVRLQDSDGSAIPDEKIDFYEYFDVFDITVYSDNPIQVDDTVDIRAKVSDVDGSGVGDEKVEFYAVMEGECFITVSPTLIQSGDSATVSLLLLDDDGNPLANKGVNLYVKK